MVRKMALYTRYYNSRDNLLQFLFSIDHRNISFTMTHSLYLIFDTNIMVLIYFLRNFQKVNDMIIICKI